MTPIPEIVTRKGIKGQVKRYQMFLVRISRRFRYWFNASLFYFDTCFKQHCDALYNVRKPLNILTVELTLGLWAAL